MLRLSAFADEISPDLDVQIEHCRRHGVSHIELRGVNKINVLDFDPALRAEVRAKLADAGMGVVAIGSPIGKVKIDQPFADHLDRYKIAVELAQYFEAPFIRLFSYYPAEGQSAEDFVANHRDEVIDRMRRKVALIENLDVTLVHENESHIYGDTGDRCLDLIESVDSPRLRNAFDFANFVQIGDDPRVNWPRLKPHTVHIHIKDALREGGKVVPAGEGDGHLPEILKDAWDSGYRGFLSLEPHLQMAGRMQGFSGPERFGEAVRALRKVCEEQGIPLVPPG